MAHTITFSNNNSVKVVLDASSAADVNFGTYFPKGAIINFIQFDPSAVNDVVCVLNGAAGAAPLLDQTDVTGGGLQVYPNMKCIPFIDKSECTLGSAAAATITIGYRFRP